jgi:hypothetical protein
MAWSSSIRNTDATPGTYLFNLPLGFRFQQPKVGSATIAPMRRVAFYGIGWLLAATAAVLLAWQGVGRVGTSFTDHHPTTLSAEQARRLLPAPPGPDPSSGGPAGGGPSGATGSAAGSDPAAGGPATPAPTATTTPRPRPTTTSTAPRPPTSKPPAVGSPVTSTSTTRPASPAPAPATGEVRTYNLVGGSVTLRFQPSGVKVVWANPNPGFQAEVDDRDGGGVRVRFDGDSHRSQLEAWWAGGPRDQVEESGGDGGSGGHGRD